MSGYFCTPIFHCRFFAGPLLPTIEDAEKVRLVYSVYNGAPIGTLYPPGEKFPDLFDDELVAMMTDCAVA